MSIDIYMISIKKKFIIYFNRFYIDDLDFEIYYQDYYSKQFFSYITSACKFF